jgi:hypothetical protein
MIVAILLGAALRGTRSRKPPRLGVNRPLTELP